MILLFSFKVGTEYITIMCIGLFSRNFNYFGAF